MNRFWPRAPRRRLLLTLAVSSFPTLAFAETGGPVGVWENPRTGMVIEFSAQGEVTMGGGAPSHYTMCGENGGNICIVGKGFECHYRAQFDSKTMTLQLFTGRPTKECPEGLFSAKPR